MKAVVFHGVGDIRVDDVPEPRLEHPNGAIVRLTASAICGTDPRPVGQFTIWSAFHLGAGRVIAVDALPDRLETARSLGAETVDFVQEAPVALVAEMTRDIGPDRMIDAVGVDGLRPAADGNHRLAADRQRSAARVLRVRDRLEAEPGVRQQL